MNNFKRGKKRKELGGGAKNKKKKDRDGPTERKEKMEIEWPKETETGRNERLHGVGESPAPSVLYRCVYYFSLCLVGFFPLETVRNL